MAITPNTDFVSGAILTAQQQNNFPRGIMQYVQSTSSTGTISAETLTLTLPSFTAVANRYYRITYYEPLLTYVSGTVNRTELNIRLTNISGAIQGAAGQNITTNRSEGIVSTVKTFSAGPVVLVGTLQVASGGGGAQAARDATFTAYMMVEDLGPA
jgi:hypothetical protein